MRVGKNAPLGTTPLVVKVARACVVTCVAIVLAADFEGLTVPVAVAPERLLGAVVPARASPTTAAGGFVGVASATTNANVPLVEIGTIAVAPEPGPIATTSQRKSVSLNFTKTALAF